MFNASNYIGLNFEYDFFLPTSIYFSTILNNNFNSPIISEPDIYYICYILNILYIPDMLYTYISDLFLLATDR